MRLTVLRAWTKTLSENNACQWYVWIMKLRLEQIDLPTESDMFAKARWTESRIRPRVFNRAALGIIASSKWKY